MSKFPLNVSRITALVAATAALAAMAGTASAGPDQKKSAMLKQGTESVARLPAQEGPHPPVHAKP